MPPPLQPSGSRRWAPGPPACGFWLCLGLALGAFITLLVLHVRDLPLWWLSVPCLIVLGWNALAGAAVVLLAMTSRERAPGARPSGSPTTITTVIPAWNEAEALPRTLSHLLRQDDQPDLILVVDDGSSDASLEVLSEGFALEWEDDPGGGAERWARSRHHRHLTVLAKPHGGKADSLNRAIAHATSDVVMVLDADTRLQPGAVAAVRRCFATDPGIHAVAGVPVPSCAAHRIGRILQFFQRYEYMRGFVFHVGWNRFDCITIISGACSAFRRPLLLRVGGYDVGSRVEDCEIIYRLQRHCRRQGERFRVRIEPRFIAHTEAPASLRDLLRQRQRWFGGFLETLLTYRHLVGNRRYGLLGIGTLPTASLAVLSPLSPLLLVLMPLAIQRSHPSDPPYWLLLLIPWCAHILLSCVRLAIYQARVRPRHLCWPHLVLDGMVSPILYQPVLALGYLWGYWSCLRRRQRW